MQAELPSAPVNEPTAKANVLLVDDNPANLLTLEVILGDQGHNLVKASSGEEALRLLLDREFAVMLLDVRMHGLDGYETAKQVRGREQSRHTPIIFLTAHDDNGLAVEEAYSLGAVDYLVRPLLPVILRAKVAGFVELFQKTEQVKRQAELLRQMERQEFERNLRESEDRFAQFMQHLPGLAWIKDLQGQYIFANDAAVAAFRTPRQELYGKTDAEVFPAATASQFEENDKRALSSGMAVQVVETLEHGDGVLHHSLVSKFPIPGPDGKVALVGGMAIDITEQKRTQAVLEESEQRFRQLAENIHEVFWMSDLQKSTLLYISPTYEDIWGRSCQSLYERPRSFLDAIHPEDRERVDVQSLARQRRGEAGDVEYRVVRPDGTVRWVRDRSFPIKDQSGMVYRIVGIAEDITQARQAEDELREADRRKDEFLAMLAHELRNPLAPMKNAVHIMRLLGPTDANLQRAREVIDRQVGHLARLVDDLLDVSRITRGKIKLHKEALELAAVVARAVETSRPVIDARRHQLTVTLPSEPVLVEGDVTRLAQVVANLLNNAAKYTEEGGHIWLTVERGPAEALVRVRDNGMGITADLLPKVFDLFTQGDRSLARSEGGLGIGLTLVKTLAEMHGGRVEVLSEGPGEGSEFVVRLRLLERRQHRRLPGSSEAAAARTHSTARRVLVVDDNADAAESMAVLLRVMGHEVRTVHDGPAALEAAELFRPEVVVLDIGLPRMDGYEVARRLRKQVGVSKALLVAVTGYGQEEDRRRSEEAGFDAHMVKPADPATLQELLARPWPSK